MKFQSRKDIVFQIITFGFAMIFIGVAIVIFVESGLEDRSSFLSSLLILSVAGLLLWMYLDTTYELTPIELKYKCGPIRGAIPIEDILEIIKGKTLWSGFKPATARNGLIIKYRKYNEIYISPKTNDTFVRNILELNSSIKVTANSNS
ncbi:hypothetical protein ES692_01275 [Psychroserpens burtonensis]|uniref:Uncharacterized protein YyaB-like PH domain-containing protein n=1 Tax=Psychroserpens burtonensis TaxID=49278 RepID=A0A5C7BDU4_9FLAO|nr:PH domain-containing protein [Psychroserpens burtonensis]TXE19919.1 hypothetical protein ES692_01275 [Psychroserpens burtonensis]